MGWACGARPGSEGVVGSVRSSAPGVRGCGARRRGGAVVGPARPKDTFLANAVRFNTTVSAADSRLKSVEYAQRLAQQRLERRVDEISDIGGSAYVLEKMQQQLDIICNTIGSVYLKFHHRRSIRNSTCA